MLTFMENKYCLDFLATFKIFGKPTFLFIHILKHVNKTDKC